MNIPVARIKKYLAGSLTFIVLFAVVGFFVLPPVIKSVLTKKLTEQLHREVSIKQVKVNPFTLAVDVGDFSIKERDRSQTFVSFGRLYLNFEAVSVFKRGVVLKEIKIERPFIHLVRNEDMTYNLSDLLKPSESKKASESKPLRFSLNNIQISKGQIDFVDAPKDKRHTVSDINITIPFLSDLSHYVDIYVQPSFAAVVNGHPVSFTGKTKPFKDSHETSFDVNIKDLDIPYYLAYLPFKMNFKVPSGFFDAKANISYTQYRDKSPSINLTGRLGFRDIKVVDSRDNRLFRLPLLQFSIASTDLISRKVNLSSINVQSLEIDLARDKKGTWNFSALIPEKAEKSKEEKSPAFTVNADLIKLSNGKISFSDLSAGAFRTDLENFEVKIDHFSNTRDQKSAAQISFKTEAG